MLITNDPKLYMQQILHTNSSRPGHPQPWPVAVQFDPPSASDGSQSNLVASIHAGILTIHQTAVLLSCGVDSLRRIPMEDLPTYLGPGRSIMYLMDDIKRYLAGRKREEKRGSGLGHSASRPRPQPHAESRNQAEIALRNLSKAVSP